MWTKTINTKFKGQLIQVQVWLSDSKEDGKEEVTVQSMFNEYYLIEQILFDGRDAAYDFIKNYPVLMANAFLIRSAYSLGVIN